MMLVPLKSLLEPCKTWNPINSPDAEFQYIDISSVDRENKKITSTTLLKGQDAPSRARQIVKSGDVLVSTVRPNLNSVAQVGADLDGATASTGFTVLRPRSTLDSAFLFHWVKTPQFVDDMVKKATGANYPAVSDRIIFESKIPLPSITEQRRIAAILDKADALHSKRREAIAKLDQLLQSVFLEIFGDPAENPKQWRRAHLGDLLVDGPQNGLYKPASFYGTGTPILRIDGFKSGDVIDTLPIKRLMLSDSEVKKYQIKSNDIIINRVNSPEHLGKAAIFTLADQVVFESNMMRISIDANQANPNYINFFLMQDFIKQQIQKSRKDAINQSSINQEDVQNFRINLPEIDVQDRFAMIIRNIARRKKQYSDQLMQFSTLQTSLQHKFFTQ